MRPVEEASTDDVEELHALLVDPTDHPMIEEDLESSEAVDDQSWDYIPPAEMSEGSSSHNDQGDESEGSDNDAMSI